MRVRLALILLAATTVRAEQNCGEIYRYATNFRATVHSVEMLGVREIVIAPVEENDLRFAVTVGVTGLEKNNLALENGATIAFGVHSPTKTFGDAEPAGKTFDMQAVWLACDDVFRRFEELVPAASRMVEVYDGWMEVGHVYRATAIGQELDPLPNLPRHHSGGLGWINAEAFLPDDSRRRTVVFEVTEQWIQHHEKGSWLNLLRGTIREVR